MSLLIQKNAHYSLPKIIWSYWDKDPPRSILDIYENNKTILKGWTYHFLNANTLTNFCNPKEFPEEYNQLSPQHKADYIRLVLLKTYGGVWLDSSIIVHSVDEINSMRRQCYATKSDLCVFSLGEPEETYLENWFIMAPKNSEAIQKWFSEFDKAVKIGFENYKTEIFKNNVYINDRIYKKDDKNVYLTQHACLQVVLQKNPFQILIYKSEDSMFKLHIQCDWDARCIRDRVKSDSSVKKLPFIKLRGEDRL